MKAVVDRIVQYANRYKLTDVSTGAVLGTFDFDEVTGTVQQVGTEIDKELFDSIADDLAARLVANGGDSKNVIVTFTEATTLENIASGEKHSTILGKVKKWFTDRISKLKKYTYDSATKITTTDTDSTIPSTQALENGDITVMNAEFANSASRAIADKNGKDITTYVAVETDPTVPTWAKAEKKPNYTKAEVGLGNVDNTADADKPISTATQTALNGKVDKVTGKQLSTNDYTTSEKNKLAGLATDTVRYGEQTLTDAQKTQARANIGAGTSSFDGTWGSLSGKPSIVQATGTSTVNIMSQNAVTNALNTVQGKIPTKVSQLSNDSNFATVSSVNAKYTKPADGIPAIDLDDDVQASLAKADSALQSAPVTSVNGKTGAVSLTASDVKALPSTTTYVSSVNGSTGAITGIATVAQVNAKQNTLSTTQLNAVNSGITADKVKTYDGYATTLAGKQNTLTAGTNIVISGSTISATAPSNMVTTDTSQTISGKKTFSGAHAFTGETTFTNGGYAPTYVDNASGIGKSSLFSRGSFDQAIVGQVIAPSSGLTDAQKTNSYAWEVGKIKFQRITSTDASAPTLEDMAVISSSGMTVLGKQVATTDQVDAKLPSANVSGTSGYIPKFTGTNTIGNSSVTQASTNDITVGGKLVVKSSGSTSTNSYNEGIRVLPAANGWSELFFSNDATTSGNHEKGWILGKRGAAGSTSGSAGDFTIECNGSSGNGLTLYADGSNPRWQNKEMAFKSDIPSLSGYLPLSGGKMTGNISWSAGGTSLPEQTSPKYFLCIDAFAEGGATKWVSLANAKTALDVPTNYVTTNTAQTVSGAKTFSGRTTLTNDLYVNSSAGEAGQVLLSQGSGKAPKWGTVSATVANLTVSSSSTGANSMGYNNAGTGSYIAIGNNIAAGSQTGCIAIGQSVSVGGTDYQIGIGCDVTALGTNSIAIGYNAVTGIKGQSNKGTNNIAIGANAQAYNSEDNSPYGCIAIGASSMAFAYGVGVGDNCNATRGAVAIGWNTKARYGGSPYGGSVVIGSYIDTPTGAVQTHIGGYSYTSTGRALILGAGTANFTYMNSAGSSWSSASDIRDKTDIEEIDHALDFIKKLKPITYVMNEREKYLIKDEEDKPILDENGKQQYDKEAHARGDKKKHRRFAGLSAQDTYQAMLDCYDGNTNYAQIVDNNKYDNPDDEYIEQYSMSYERLVPFLIKAMQEQQAEIDELKKELRSRG